MAQGYAVSQDEPMALAGQSQPSGIQWGRVLRGVAVITAVAVAAFVGYGLVSSAVNGASEVPWIASTATAIGNGFVFMAEFLGAAAAWVWAGIAAAASALWAGISGGSAVVAPVELDPEKVANISNTLGIGGAITGGMLAAKTVAPLLADPTLAAPAVKTAAMYDPQSLAAQQYAGASGTHAFKIGHHAVEHMVEQKAKTSFAQRVSASRAAQSPPGVNGSAAHVNPRNSSYIQELKESRAALEAALSEPKR